MKTQKLRSLFWKSKGMVDQQGKLIEIPFTQVAEHISDTLTIKDANSLRYIYINKAAEKAIGVSENEVVGKSDKELFFKEQAEYLVKTDNRILNNKRFENIGEEPIATKKNGVRWFETKKIPIFDADSKIKSILSISKDISLQRLAEEQKLLLELEKKARYDSAYRVKRLKFIADAAIALNTNLEFESNLAVLARLVVPAFADLFAVHLLEGKTFKSLYQNTPGILKLTPHNHVRKGIVEFIPSLAKVKFNKSDLYRQDIEALKLLNVQSYICAPLMSKKKVIGAISLCMLSLKMDTMYCSEDVKMTQELAMQISVALRNSKQFEESQRLNQAKDQFLSKISHQLRTPLSVIQGYSELLQNEKLSASEKKFAIDAIYRNSRLQNKIVNELLDISSIIEGKTRFLPMSLDPCAILYSTLNSAKGVAEKKGVILSHNIYPGEVHIMADPIRFREVIWKLLTNAVMFTDAGGMVNLSSRVKNQVLTIIIEDSGHGINPEFLPHIFDRFIDAHTSDVRKIGWTGSGLSVVKSIVELHGGSIRVRSDGAGKGTTFVLRFPLIKKVLEKNVVSSNIRVFNGANELDI